MRGVSGCDICQWIPGIFMLKGMLVKAPSNPLSAIANIPFGMINEGLVIPLDKVFTILSIFIILPFNKLFWVAGWLNLLNFTQLGLPSLINCFDITVLFNYVALKWLNRWLAMCLKITTMGILPVIVNIVWRVTQFSSRSRTNISLLIPISYEAA